MKSKPTKNKHKQSNKPPYRLLTELVGLVVFAYVLWSARGVVADSFGYIKNANKAFILTAFASIWLTYLWSALGYRLLLKNKVNLLQMSLTHLAASGPGRIVPAGGGHLSFGILFLRKKGYSLAQALAVGVTNNVLGFLVNTVAILVAVVFLPTSFSLKNPLNATSYTVALAAALVLVVLLLAASKKIHEFLVKTKKQLGATLKLLHKQPHRIVLLVATMFAMMATHTLALYLCAAAIQHPVTLLQSFVAISIGVGVGSALPTPGGVGGVEAGIIASLVFAGIDTQAATAIAILYRSASYIQPLLPGFVAYVYLRRKKVL